jgi:predicted ATP-grasp superfamily ATP-dependent carboligase
LATYYGTKLRKPRNTCTPQILVTDGQERSVLAAIRCLGAAGYRVSGTATSWLAPGLWSRRCSGRIVLADPRDCVDAFLGQLEAVARAERPDLLLPGTDFSLYAISLARDRLEPHVRLALPDHAIVERALDRAYVEKCASRAGLAVPESRVCERVELAAEVAASYGYPVLIKPVRAVVQTGGRLVRHASRLAGDVAQLRDACARLGPCIVQRRHAGTVLSFAGVAGNGSLHAAVASRYLRTWPAAAGNVCFSETIEVSETLHERVQSLVGAIGWEGLFELELIELAGGRHEAIDFNPRPYGSLSLARAAGVPLATIWCRWALGQPGSFATARAGRRYRWEDADLRHLIWQLRAGDPGAALGAARPGRGVAHAYFQAADPAPAAMRVAELTRDGLRKGRRTRSGPVRRGRLVGDAQAGRACAVAHASHR